jgi:hypothetical protein
MSTPSRVERTGLIAEDSKREFESLQPVGSKVFVFKCEGLRAKG